MVRSCLRRLRIRHAIFLFAFAFVKSWAQSTSTSLPPLQWLNLTNHLTGSSPPPLIGASIGYDDATRSLLIFGGISDAGFVQSGTYLLNLETLTWSLPNPPANLQNPPPARSYALSGDDFAADYRRAHIIVGGKSDTAALSDVWEFDYNNEFWAEVEVTSGGPSPRWGSSGGLDVIVAPTADGLNNTLYLAGGTSEQGPLPLSDVWALNISGTLSPNLPNSVQGSWQKDTFTTLPGYANQAGTIVGSQIIAAGGCNTTSLNTSCAQQETYVLSTASGGHISPGACAIPRYAGALAQNFNTFSTSYASQAFFVLGTFNTSIWDADDGLNKGEVDVLDINTGTWTRILPAGDPGSSGSAAYPSPRVGAAILSFSSALVGSSRSTASDTIIFGGRDDLGKFLSEVWLLRAYNGEITASGDKWSGYGNGQLETGIDASGAGVSLTYLKECVSQFGEVASTTTLSLIPSSTSQPISTSTSVSVNPGFTVGITHKVLAPLSVALLFPAILLVRCILPSTSSGQAAGRNTILLSFLIVDTVTAFAAGIAGLVFSFTTTTAATSSLQKRNIPNSFLKATHGRAGFALFICLYGIIPTLYIARIGEIFVRHRRRSSINTGRDIQTHPSSPGPLEKPASVIGDGVSSHPSVDNASPPLSPGVRVSWSGQRLWAALRNHEPRISSDTESCASAHVVQPAPAFQVVNRPQRMIRTSVTGATSLYSRGTYDIRNIDWLERRRSLNAVGELDYALSQANRTPGLTTPATIDTAALVVSTVLSASQPIMPRPFDCLLQFLLQLILLAVSVFTLVALWSFKYRAGFAVFLAWTVAFYFVLFILAWQGRPSYSVLSVLIMRLRAPTNIQVQTPFTPLTSPSGHQYAFPTDARGGPYVHQPLFRAVGTDDVSTVQGPRSVEEDDDDEDIDEDTRQRRIEDEMARRDVSIVTVPRRKLWIANPSDHSDH